MTPPSHCPQISRQVKTLLGNGNFPALHVKTQLSKYDSGLREICFPKFKRVIYHPLMLLLHCKKEKKNPSPAYVNPSPTPDIESGGLPLRRWSDQNFSPFFSLHIFSFSLSDVAAAGKLEHLCLPPSSQKLQQIADDYGRLHLSAVSERKLFCCVGTLQRTSTPLHSLYVCV